MIITVVAAAGALVVGLFLGLTFGFWMDKRLRQRNRELRAALKTGAEPAKTETMKRVIWACLAMGFAWVWCSYILAYLDHPQIAESLSQVAVTEIIGVVLAYAIKSSIENLSKHNRWPDRGDPPGEALPDDAPPDESGGEEGGVG